MTIINHWGIWVDSEKPIGGVAQNNRIEFLSDECADGINLSYNRYVKDYSGRRNTEKFEKYLDQWESTGDDTILIGSWKKDRHGKYYPDSKGDYAAIVGEVYCQVVFSKTTKLCRLCSPCYPGQGDLNSDGDFLTYDLPAELYGTDEQDNYDYSTQKNFD